MFSQSRITITIFISISASQEWMFDYADEWKKKSNWKKSKAWFIFMWTNTEKRKRLRPRSSTSAAYHLTSDVCHWWHSIVAVSGSFSQWSPAAGAHRDGEPPFNWIKKYTYSYSYVFATHTHTHRIHANNNNTTAYTAYRALACWTGPWQRWHNSVV